MLVNNVDIVEPEAFEQIPDETCQPGVPQPNEVRTVVLDAFPIPKDAEATAWWIRNKTSSSDQRTAIKNAPAAVQAASALEGRGFCARAAQNSPTV